MLEAASSSEPGALAGRAITLLVLLWNTVIAAGTCKSTGSIVACQYLVFIKAGSQPLDAAQNKSVLRAADAYSCNWTHRFMLR